MVVSSFIVEYYRSAPPRAPSHHPSRAGASILNPLLSSVPLSVSSSFLTVPRSGPRETTSFGSNFLFSLIGSGNDPVLGVAESPSTGSRGRLEDRRSRWKNEPLGRTSFLGSLSLNPVEQFETFFKMVNMYPQMHHPALATTPLILMSNNNWRNLINPSPKTALEMDEVLKTATTEEAAVDGMQKITGQETDSTAALKQYQEEEDVLARFQPFMDPGNPMNTRVLFPVPNDW